MSIPKLNHTQIPNYYIDNYMGTEKSFVSTVFFAICRKTIGWHKDTDYISHSQLIKATGLSINTIKKSIKRLQEQDLIQVSREGTGRGTCTFYTINFQSEEEKEEEENKSNMSQENISQNNISQHDTINELNVSRCDIINEFNVSRRDTTKESNINKNNINKYKKNSKIDKTIFQDLKQATIEFWNSQPRLVKHSKIAAHEKYVESSIKRNPELSLEDIQQCIKLYSDIMCENENKVFAGNKYRWTLGQFFQGDKGITKFYGKTIEDFYDAKVKEEIELAKKNKTIVDRVNKEMKNKYKRS